MRIKQITYEGRNEINMRSFGASYDTGAVGTIDHNSGSADQVRNNRGDRNTSEEHDKQTRDYYEKTGLQEVVYPAYTKFQVIKTPCASTVKEMRELMEGYYNGSISKDEIKDYFIKYADIRYAWGDKEILLNIYESFLDQNYIEAVSACFNKGKEIAGADDYLLYYDADYYYMSEEIHDFLKQIVKEYSEKNGMDVDPDERDQNFQGQYLTGKPNFNDKWNFMASCTMHRGGMVDPDKVPPKGFSFFYKPGEGDAVKGTDFIIGGNGWKENVDVPWEPFVAGNISAKRLNLLDFLHINKEKESMWIQYNAFLKNFFLARF